MENKLSIDDLWKSAVSNQFDAAIKSLANAMDACPDELWRRRMWNDRAMDQKFSEFWYIAYHTLFFLDLYLSGSVDGFVPPVPFTLDELDPAGKFPERCYSRDELQTYSNHCRQKYQQMIALLTDEKAGQNYSFPWGNLSYVELLLDNMRHIQEHAAQLNRFLGQQNGTASR